MAKTKKYYPGTTLLQLAWWLNLIEKMITYTGELDITEAEQMQVAEDEAMFNYLFTYETQFRIFMVAFVKYRNDLLAGKTGAYLGLPPVCAIPEVPTKVLSALLNRLFTLVGSFKKRGGYTVAIGKDMLIIGADIPAFDPDTYIANGRGKTLNTGNKINFTKGLFIEGMQISMMRGAETVFTVIKQTSESGWIDSALNLVDGPETRTYITQAYIGSNLIGFPSPPFKLTWTSPPPPPPVMDAKDGEAPAAPEK
jgi:hypothetical protein